MQIAPGSRRLISRLDYYASKLDYPQTLNCLWTIYRINYISLLHYGHTIGRYLDSLCDTIFFFLMSRYNVHCAKHANVVIVNDMEH